MTRRTLGAALTLTLALAAGAQSPPAATSTLPLLPYPRQLTAVGAGLRLSGAVSIAVASGDADDRFAAGQLADELGAIEHVHATVVAGTNGGIVLARSDSATGRRILQESNLSLPPEAAAEGYALSVNGQRAAVVADSSAGIFYGIQTLRQLFHPDGAGAAAPGVQIVDWPALRWRGLQADVSRGPIPTLAAIERDLGLLSEFKLNVYVLYFENTYAYRSLPVFNAPGGAIDAAEAAQIVATARKYHITVIPQQEAFGHLHLGLQEEKYQDLVELPYGNVLTPAVPAALDFIGQMFQELNQAFPGPFFHIGADETAELGQGRSADLQKSEGAGPLYLDYLKQIDQRLAPYHRQVLFWGDIAQGHPELLSQLPKDMIAVPWQYNPQPSFTRYIKPFRDAGLETWVSPGVNNWSRIYPDFDAALRNISGFVADGRKLGITGVLNTTWMDDGESLFDFTWYGDAFGAAVSWEDQPDTARFQNAYDWALYRADGHHFFGEVDKLTAIVTSLKGAPVRSTSTDDLMWQEPFTKSGQDLYGRMEPMAHQMRLQAEDVIADLAANAGGARRYPELLDPVRYSAWRFDFVGEKAIYAKYIATLYDAGRVPGAPRAKISDAFSRINGMNGLLQDMRDGDTSLREQYRALWLESNTPYFLDNILLRYDAESMYWQQQAQRFSDLSAAWRATGVLPPLYPGAPTTAAAPATGGG